MLLRKTVSDNNIKNSLIKTLFSIVTLAGDVFIGKVFRNLQTMAVQLEQVNVASVRRSFNTIKAIFNLAIAEHGIEMRNHSHQSTCLRVIVISGCPYLSKPSVKYSNPDMRQMMICAG